MTVKELYKILSDMIPAELSCSWDNDGLMCCPDGSREVGRVLVTLDVTDDAVNEAVAGGYDVIISHHPMIFKGLKAVSEDNFIAAKSIKLIKNNISVMSFHTRLDAVSGGVNDVLAALLGLSDVRSFGEEGIGRIGVLPCEMTLDAFAQTVKNTLSAPVVLCADAKKSVRRVAVLGGEGGDDIAAARAAGADTYVSGRLGYHNMTDAPECDINLIEAGHFYTEFPVCKRLCEILAEIDGNIKTDIFCSNKIRAI